MYYRIEAENLAQLYKKAALQFEELPAFAVRKTAMEWDPISYRELYEQGLCLATALIELGVDARDHVGLFSDNRLEWILADYAVQCCGAADVPRGRDVSNAELIYIINHSGLTVTFVENIEMAKRVLALKCQLHNLKEIIVLKDEENIPEDVRRFKDVYHIGKELREKGDRRVEERMNGIKPDDLFTLIYTSGTTGTPKGVMLTHSNIMSQTRNLPGKHNCNDRSLSVLPIWHIFERVIEMYTLSFGGCTFYSSVQNLAEDMRNVEPTFMASAPRIWEKLYERILKNVKHSHWMRQILFHTAYFLAKHYKSSEYFLTNTNLQVKYLPSWKRILLMPWYFIKWLIVIPWYGFFNAAVLERIRMGAGGGLKITISGGGALPYHVDKFFNNVGIPVLEGYGMTETTPVISVREKLNLIVGTVGPPIKETEIKIVDLETSQILYPNSNLPYNGKMQRGEIWVKGPQVMKGYYKEPELTDMTMKDGWLRTGDLGVITHNNNLKILGRSKSTIVLKSGENVEPEPIEMSLLQSPYIENCVVLGQDKKFLGVLIIPSLPDIRLLGFKELTVKEILNNDIAMKIIRNDVKRIISSANGFKKHEQIRYIGYLTESFKVGEELTNLFKLKRHIIEKKYSTQIDELFKEELKK
ncbi:MAG: long-chain fatty acid--CoA ligase [Bacteroidetes bacterium]|nr:long-chain fatty acid--CoA ligase [Bacteroidota bacterium]